MRAFLVPVSTHLSGLKSGLVICLLALGLSACNERPDAPAPSRFITEAVTIQPGAEIPRDEAGRPYSNRLLGQAFPDISGVLIDGTAWSSETLQGRWTVVDIWGLWCPDCMADAPYVAQLALILEGEPDIHFLSIHTPPNRARLSDAFGKYGSVEAYFETVGYSYPTLVDQTGDILEALLIDWRPTYLLVGPDGKVHAFRSDFSVGGAEGVTDAITQIKAIQAESGL